MDDDVVSRLFEGCKPGELPGSAKDARAIGIVRYFTGQPCKRGHIAPRWTSSFGCVQCVHLWQKAHPEVAAAWLDKNRDKMRAVNRASARRHKDRTNKAGAAWRARNPDKVKARKRSPEAVEKTRVKSRALKAKNAEKIREQNRAWRKANPDKIAVYQSTRRARKLQAEGAHTAADIAAIRVLQKDMCANSQCKKRLRGKGHIDHIVALASGGSNWPRNLQLLCASCNRSKGARDPIEFMQSHGLLL